MSITLNNSDFQCLQDQLLDLKTKNYELAEKNRRGQADFEAAKAKICSLQLKLEEQERDFQVTSTTLRQEIESAYSIANNTSGNANGTEAEVDYKTEHKKLLRKNEELQQRFDESAEIMQQMDSQNKNLDERVRALEEDNSKLKEALTDREKQIDVIKKEFENKLSTTIGEYKSLLREERKKSSNKLDNISQERDSLKEQVNKLNVDMKAYDGKLESQAEEQKIHERRGLKIVKELKRQLALEKSRSETLQKRLENLLKEPPVAPTNLDLDSSIGQLSTTSSSINGNSSTSNENSSRTTNQDANSVESWSFVPIKQKSIDAALSICSIDSEDRETVQRPCDTNSDNSNHCVLSGTSSTTRLNPTSDTSASDSTTNQAQVSPLQSQIDGLRQSLNSPSYSPGRSATDGMLIEEQAALVDRVTKMQHEKWMLEEKLSYLEQANSSLSEDLANKSDIIKHYFMDQALKANHSNHSDGGTPSILSALNGGNSNLVNRRTSFPSNMNYLLSEKPSLKKVVDFLKERGQNSISNESENISKEAMKKMQLMLEETLIKCLKLQENLDFVSSELNKHKS